ncbi:hypothetical protein J6590_038404 [Homalodisca vitripennis]|nr:hypothetical protein J6590_038404 [Homalodisca vitripennis]
MVHNTCPEDDKPLTAEGVDFEFDVFVGVTEVTTLLYSQRPALLFSGMLLHARCYPLLVGTLRFVTLACYYMDVATHFSSPLSASSLWHATLWMLLPTSRRHSPLRHPGMLLHARCYSLLVATLRFGTLACCYMHVASRFSSPLSASSLWHAATCTLLLASRRHSPLRHPGMLLHARCYSLLVATLRFVTLACCYMHVATRFSAPLSASSLWHATVWMLLPTSRRHSPLRHSGMLLHARCYSLLVATLRFVTLECCYMHVATRFSAPLSASLLWHAAPCTLLPASRHNTPFRYSLACCFTWIASSVSNPQFHNTTISTNSYPPLVAGSVHYYYNFPSRLILTLRISNLYFLYNKLQYNKELHGANLMCGLNSVKSMYAY